MTDKEIGELRRRIRKDKCAVPFIYGAFINEKKELVSTFRQNVAMLPQNDAEGIFKIMRKAFSGAAGKNLLDVSFPTEQVMNGEEHKMLMEMRKQTPESEPFIQSFFEKTAENLTMPSAYIILLAQDAYDIPDYGADGEKADSSTEVYNYFFACACPIKESKAALGFIASENAFKTLGANAIISAPEIGIVFPAFDDRSANIYNMLLYSKNLSDNHSEFVTDFLKGTVPMPAQEQKDTFNAVLEEALSDSCSFDVAVAVRDAVCDEITENKENNEEEAPVVSKKSIGRVLEKCGVDAEKIEAFEERFEESFGADAAVSPVNLVNTKQIDIETPDVSIKINSDRSDLIKTQMIDGSNYILIRADVSISVNGVNVCIDPKN